MRWSSFTALAALLLIGGVDSAPAQEAQECKCECVTPRAAIGMFREGIPQLMWLGQRARLGVYVHSEANPETDRYGALIDGVADGSPAAKAGLQEGDIITKLNGRDLLSGEDEYEEDESAPGRRLVARARELERGDTVEIEYRRDGDTKTVELVAGEFDEHVSLDRMEHTDEFGRSARLYDMARRLRELPEIHVEGPETFALRLGTRIPGLELTSLNEDLGEYFGADEGVLVLSVPEKSELELKAGDVIQAIDGRSVRSPSHAMRILRSYDADEEVSFRILRQKGTRTVKGKIPEAMGEGPRVLRIEREN